MLGNINSPIKHMLKNVLSSSVLVLLFEAIYS